MHQLYFCYCFLRDVGRLGILAMLDESFTFSQTQRVASIVARVKGTATKPGELCIDEPLIDAGVTSVEMVELMLGLESAYDLMIPDDELNSINFTSIKTIAALLMRLMVNR